MTGECLNMRVLTVSFAVALVVASAVGIAAQQPKPPGPPKKAAAPVPGKAAATSWPPRTVDGQPDIQGVWSGAEFGTWTAWLENTSYLYSIGMKPLGRLPKAKTPIQLPGMAMKVRESAVIDPPSGILPYQPWALERRNSVMKDYLKPTPWQMDTQTPGWPTGVPRENAYSSFDGSYGGPINILQPPGYVVFLYETHHEFRVIPLDGRPQPGRDIKLWEGSSRGHWEGNTLVVDVTNNNDSPRLSVIGDFRSDAFHAT